MYSFIEEYRKENQNIRNIAIIIDKINDLKEVSYHKSIANRQRKTYEMNKDCPNILESKILIDQNLFKEIKKNVSVWVLEYIMLT